MQSTTSMVQIAGVTYRIVRVGLGQYAAVRIQDETEVGTFTTRPRLRVESSRIEAALMEQIARTAFRQAKTSWAGVVVSLPAGNVSNPRGR